jgi:hypothetical protein
MNQQTVPATRLGLVLSILGFTVLSAISTSDSAVGALGTTYSVSWILLVLAIVALPRLIRPGHGWARQRCRRVPANVLFAAAAITAIVGTFLASGFGAAPAIAASAVTLGLAAVATFLPPAPPQIGSGAG